MTKEVRIYSVGKIVSSINGAGKTEQLHMKFPAQDNLTKNIVEE